MIRSMTGYGQASLTKGNELLRIEMKSVNHRHSEVQFRMPREWNKWEDRLRKLLLQVIARGRVEFFAVSELVQSAAVESCIDWEKAASYVSAAQQLGERFGIPSALSVQDLLQLPDLLQDSDSSTGDLLTEEELLALVQDALDMLIQMRDREGQHLAADMAMRMQGFKELYEAALLRAPEVATIYRKKLQARLDEWLSGVPIDEERLNAEVAIFADRTNIDEELVRLASHQQQWQLIVAEGGPVGRKLDFLLQEMNREVNTIGSKANDADLIIIVVQMKTELEKIREQVQNIE